MALYPMPKFANVADLFIYANTVTNNFFGPLMLLTIFSILFTAQYRFGFQKSFASSIFITTLCSYFFFILGMIGSWIVLVFTALVALSVFFLHRRS